MSYIKLNEEGFLGKQELNRHWDFLTTEGFIKDRLLAKSFGIIKDAKDSGFTNFLVNAGTNANTIQIPVLSKAINGDGKYIIKKAEDNILIPSTGSTTGWWWVKIKHEYTPIEEGTISIDTAGNLTGTHTKFLSLLRGYPNFAVTIKFYSNTTLLNSKEYVVAEVISDTSAKLSGDFVAESNLQYSIVGTFTPGYVVPSTSKEIYQYDSCLLTLVPEITLNTAPSKIDGSEFYIARVNISSGLVIEDKRNEFFNLGEGELQEMITTQNKVFGVDEVRWMPENSTKDKNIVRVSWGFQSNNFTINSSTRVLTINGGLGGRFKDTSYFTNGDFNGWMCYSNNNKSLPYKIYQSTKSGSQINLTLEGLILDNFLTTDWIYIVPPVEEITIQLYYQDTGSIGSPGQIHENLVVQKTFPISPSYGDLEVVVDGTICQTKYAIKFQYKNYKTYSVWQVPLADSVGYWDETSFDVSGVLGTGVRFPYTPIDYGGYIKLCPHPSSYSNILNQIYLGDNLGVSNTTIIPANLVLNLQVGTSKQYQNFNGSVIFGNNFHINLDKTGAKNGNAFILHFNFTGISLGANKIFITEDYVSVVSFTNLFEITELHLRDINSNITDLKIGCIYNGTSWLIFPFHDSNFEMALRSICADVLLYKGVWTALDINAITTHTLNYGHFIDITTNNFAYEFEDVVVANTVYTTWDFKYKIFGKKCSLDVFLNLDTFTDVPSSINNDYFLYGLMLENLPSNIRPKKEAVIGQAVIYTTPAAVPVFRGRAVVLLDNTGKLRLFKDIMSGSLGFVDTINGNPVAMVPNFNITSSATKIEFNLTYELN